MGRVGLGGGGHSTHLEAACAILKACSSGGARVLVHRAVVDPTQVSSPNLFHFLQHKGFDMLTGGGPVLG